MSVDVLVIGGGNAALCAALSAREAGASVMMLEAAPRDWRGGNSPHTRNLRCMHDAPADVLTERYGEDEYWQDLLRVTGGHTDEELARRVIRESATCRDWMRARGVRFQPSLGGTLQLSRTNAFFLGGGKALVNAYYRAAERLGVTVRYGARVTGLEIVDGRFVAARLAPAAQPGSPMAAGMAPEPIEERISARCAVVAAGGFESNFDWLREAWGPGADNFLIRGTAFNQGEVLRALLAAGATEVGDPTQCHAVAIDARAPRYDGGIVTRIDAVSLGIVVDRDARRFYDEGEDFWPKRYAIWGRLVARLPGQIAYAISDAKAIGRYMPPVFPGERGRTLAELAGRLGLDAERLQRTVTAFNEAIRPGGHFDHAILDDCATQGLEPPKSHWAVPIDTPPFIGFPLRPGITFTYLGVKVNARAQVAFDAGARRSPWSPNLFAAGEIMAGNILGQGYLAGFGMTIGTVFGRIAGEQAARMALAAGAAHAAHAAHAGGTEDDRYTMDSGSVVETPGAARAGHAPRAGSR